MSTKTPVIFAVSDATGDLASDLAFSGLRQFDHVSAPIFQRPRVNTPEKINQIIREARESQGLVIFTLVSQDLRAYMTTSAQEAGVLAFDLMGPLLEVFGKYLHQSPSNRPGMQYQLTREYLRRNEAVEFTIKHDDGLGLETLSEADIVLLGISRTSKTPISIYLAFRGFKVANIPIIKNVPLPSEIWNLSQQKIVGLTMAPLKLVELRRKRLGKLGRIFSESYADLENIRDEIAASKEIFEKFGSIPIIDSTDKAIEEVATEILLVFTTRQRPDSGSGEP